MQREHAGFAYPAAEVQAVVARALDGGVGHESMIRRAAAGLAAVCRDELDRRGGGVYGRRVALLVGSGHNGADALFAGAGLARRGVRVDAVLVGKSFYGNGMTALRRAGGRAVDAASDGAAARAVLRRADLVVDGIVGDRGRGGLSGVAAELVAGLRDCDAVVVSVDLPSGVDPDSGELAGEYVRPDVTVTFGVPKPCLLLPPACQAAGRQVTVDVGLPMLPAKRWTARRMGVAEVAAAWPVPAVEDHKYRRGVLGVVAGSEQYPGAAVLACLGAVRSGVGMARYVGPGRAGRLVLASTPEVVPGVGRVQAWLLGPGLDGEPNEHVGAALASGQPCVVDAGAISACVPARARGYRPSSASQVLLTPHAGELAAALTLTGRRTTRAEVERRPAHYARLFAHRANSTVLLKGATTLVVGPDGRIGSVAQAPAWLATAGAGDVLAGIAGALLAAGLPAWTAGQVAAFVHGRAAARASGGGPVDARSVADAVPATVAELLTHRPTPPE